MSYIPDMKIIAKTAPAIGMLIGGLLILIGFTTDISSGGVGLILFLISAFLYSLPYIPDIIDALK